MTHGASEVDLLGRALELGGYVLLRCDAALNVVATHGACEGLVVDGTLEASLADAVRARLATGRASSTLPLRTHADFRLMQVDADGDQLLVWLRHSAAGRAAFGKRLRERYGFKLRSQQLLVLLTQGLCNRAIAEQLGLRVATVKTYLHEVYETLGVRSRTAALAELNRALYLEP